MFISLWNKTRSDCSPAYLSALQKQLTDALPAYLNSTENQAADLRISQQWLRTMVWQLSIQNGCLSSGNDDPSMTFQYPVEIARDLVSMTSQFSHQSMEVHGIGLVSSPARIDALNAFVNNHAVDRETLRRCMFPHRCFVAPTHSGRSLCVRSSRLSHPIPHPPLDITKWRLAISSSTSLKSA
jgi:hypothetical protein